MLEYYHFNCCGLRMWHGLQNDQLIVLEKQTSSWASAGIIVNHDQLFQIYTDVEVSFSSLIPEGLSGLNFVPIFLNSITSFSVTLILPTSLTLLNISVKGSLDMFLNTRSVSFGFITNKFFFIQMGWKWCETVLSVNILTLLAAEYKINVGTFLLLL